MIEITICPDAWKLYDIWMTTLRAQPIDMENVRISRNAYIQHRENCPLCTPVQKVYANQTDENNQD